MGAANNPPLLRPHISPTVIGQNPSGPGEEVNPSSPGQENLVCDVLILTWKAAWKEVSPAQRQNGRILGIGGEIEATMTVTDNEVIPNRLDGLTKGVYRPVVPLGVIAKSRAIS